MSVTTETTAQVQTVAYSVNNAINFVDQDLASTEPDLLIVHMGTNDLSRGATADSIIHKVWRLEDTLKHSSVPNIALSSIYYS